MTTYLIEINEYQRQLLVKVLTSANTTELSRVGGGDAFDTEEEEFVTLLQMFGTLPDEAAQGGEGMIHGFCR